MKNDYPDGFKIGDHVYKWCSFGGIPTAFQHHGIILDCYLKTGVGWVLKIVDFLNVNQPSPDGTTDDANYSSAPFSSCKQSCSGLSQSSSGSGYDSSTGSGYELRTFEVSLLQNDEKWYKVMYGATMWELQFERTGTCTAARSDPPALVCARAQFLLDNPEILPKYDAVTANCECVAVWCKTGIWETLQAKYWLMTSSMGLACSAVKMGSIAATTQVPATVPAAGVWGWMGYTASTTVPLLSTQPYLLPAIVGYGVVASAVPAFWLLHSKSQAKVISEYLNTLFSKHSTE
jgi:hypothetical protein